MEKTARDTRCLAFPQSAKRICIIASDIMLHHCPALIVYKTDGWTFWLIVMLNVIDIGFITRFLNAQKDKKVRGGVKKKW